MLLLYYLDFAGCGWQYKNVFLVFTNIASKWKIVLSFFLPSIISCPDTVISSNHCWYSLFFFLHCFWGKKITIELCQITVQELNFLELLYSSSWVWISLLVGWCLIKQELHIWALLGDIWELASLLHLKFKQQICSTVQRSQSPLVLNLQRFLRWMKLEGVGSIVPVILNLNSLYNKILFSILLGP